MRTLFLATACWCWMACAEPAPKNGKEAREPVTATRYTDSTEVHITHPPLVVNEACRMTFQLTRLRETFVPWQMAQVTASLIVQGKGVRNKAVMADNPGTCYLSLKPVVAGEGQLIIEIGTGNEQERVVMSPVTVYADETDIPVVKGADVSGTVRFTKQDQWAIRFSSQPVLRLPMQTVIKTTGQLLAAPGNEATVPARSPGVVKFRNRELAPGVMVRAGQELFAIGGGDVSMGGNIDIEVERARIELHAAEEEFERARLLVEKQLITRHKFQEAELNYKSRRLQLEQLTRNYGGGGKIVTAPATGFVQSVLVSEGDYVQAGAPLATLLSGDRMLLRAELPVNRAAEASAVTNAEFVLQQNDQVYNTALLQGKLVSAQNRVKAHGAFLPLFFEITRQPGWITGSHATVYLETGTTEPVLQAPTEALLEEQGLYFVYVQKNGETFEKREVQPGRRNHAQVEIVSGLSEGERIVTRGAYRIKLAAAIFPSGDHHGHNH